TRAEGGMRWFNRNQERPIEKVKNQAFADVEKTFPSGVNPVRMNEWMNRPHQRWQVVAVPEKGGYLGGPYFKIVVEGTNRALAATAEAEVVTVPEYTGADEQLWRIDQCIDGTYRIMPKSVPGHNGENFVLYSIGDSTPTLAKFDFNNDNSKWNFRKK
ncbi:MAG: RICIN domain-containing protein, partial [Bacteroidales bacterium]|nr:RICIN domain-containing protein [Bacteroidales bacterium]